MRRSAASAVRLWSPRAIDASSYQRQFNMHQRMDRDASQSQLTTLSTVQQPATLLAASPSKPQRGVMPNPRDPAWALAIEIEYKTLVVCNAIVPVPAPVVMRSGLPRASVNSYSSSDATLAHVVDVVLKRIVDSTTVSTVTPAAAQSGRLPSDRGHRSRARLYGQCAWTTACHRNSWPLTELTGVYPLFRAHWLPCCLQGVR